MTVWLLLQRYTEYPEQSFLSPHQNIRVIRAYKSKEAAEKDVQTFHIEGVIIQQVEVIE